MDRESRDLAKFMQRTPKKGKDKSVPSGLLRLDLVKDLGLSPSAVGKKREEQLLHTEHTGSEYSSVIIKYSWTMCTWVLLR